MATPKNVAPKAEALAKDVKVISERAKNLQTLKVLVDQKFIKIVSEMQPVDGQLKTVTKFIITALGRNPATVPIAYCPVSGMSLANVYEGEIVNASQATFGNGDNASK